MTQDNAALVVTLTQAPPGGVVTGTNNGKLYGSFQNGDITFPNLSVNVDGTYTFSVTSNGLTKSYVVTTSGRRS